MSVVCGMRFRIPSFAGPGSDRFQTGRVSVPDRMVQIWNPAPASIFGACATKGSHLRAASDNFAMND